MIEFIIVVLIGAILGLMAYAFYTGAFPSISLGAATSTVTAGTTTLVAMWSGFIDFLHGCISGLYGYAGTLFVIGLTLVITVWTWNVLDSWAQNKPAAMVR